MPKIATADRVDRDGLLEFLRPGHRAVLLPRRRGGGAQPSPVTCGVDAGGRVVVPTCPQRAEATDARRDAAVFLCVLPDEWEEPWVQVEGAAEVLDLPEVLEPLVEHHRAIGGEHLGGDGYRGDDPPGYVPAPGHRDRMGPGRGGGLPVGTVSKL